VTRGGGLVVRGIGVRLCCCGGECASVAKVTAASRRRFGHGRTSKSTGKTYIEVVFCVDRELESVC